MTSSSTSTGILSSPRIQQRLIWIGGAVFIAGLAAFLAVVVFRGGSGNQAPPAAGTVKLSTAPTKAPPAPEALAVARKFLETAVVRQNLDEAYPIVTSALKGGITRKQWDAGSIPVTPYPARNASTSRFQVDSSYKNQVNLEVVLVAKPGTGVRPQLDFFLSLVRSGKNGPWRVSYFQPHYTVPVPEAPNAQ